MSQILYVIAPLFIIIFFSAVVQKFAVLGDEWSDVLNSFALNIGFPVLVFSALSRTPFSFAEHALVIVSNSVFIVAIFALTYFIGKTVGIATRMLRTVFLCLVFGNVAYLGIPILVQTSGTAILPTASLIAALYVFWVFTLGIAVLDMTLHQEFKNIISDTVLNLVKNPLLIAIVLGIAVSAAKLSIPAVVASSLDMVTASVTPTVLIVIGLFIGRSTIGNVGDWIPVFVFSFLTLLAMPAVFYVGVRLLGYAPSQFYASIIQAAMPLGITPFALADKYDLDKAFIARTIVLSTILSVVSLPLWIILVG
jgi:predicted permease